MVRRRDLLATIGSGADLALRQGLQFLVLLILARILTPSDFGKVALLALFVSFAVVLADLGIGTALIQARSLTSGDISTAFWASASTGAVLTAAGALLARPLSVAFAAPNLAGLAGLMSLTVLFTSIGAVPTALLIKRLQFGRLLVAGAIATSISGVVAVIMALNGKGVWALAVQSVLMAGVSAVATWLAVPERPSRRWNVDSARRLMGMGRFVLAANVCDVAYARFIVLLVGSVFGPGPLGYYLRADSTQQIPADAASAILGRVALPVFSEAREDLDGLRTGLRMAIRSVTAVNAPALALAGALSGPLVTTLFGPQWSPSAPLLSILCLGGLLWPLHVMNVNLMYAMGEARTVFRIDLVKKFFGLVAIGCGALLGIHQVAWATVVVGFFALIINGRVTGRLVRLGAIEQLQAVAPATMLAVAVSACVAVIAHLWKAAPAVELVVLGAIGACMYLVLARLLRVTAVLETFSLVRQLRQPVS